MKRRVFPYWKVQVPDPAGTGSWVDVQRAYTDKMDAWHACPVGGRLVQVQDRRTRFPLGHAPKARHDKRPPVGP